MAKNIDSISLDGVSTNNLKNINVRIPLNKLTVVTGVSGSGKSSLVFDTLYGESYRRYVESLSSYARQYLKALPKPTIREVHHLPPAIAVKQTRSGTNNRSTVGTLTELTDLMRILYAHLSIIHCIKCGKVVEKDNPESIAKKVLSQFDGVKAMILAPLRHWEGMKPKELKEQLESQGFSRLFHEGAARRIDEVKLADLERSCVVIDRVEVNVQSKQRLVESFGLGLKVGRGHVEIANDKKILESFSAALECCGVTYMEPSIELFSFNHPLGACTKCQGFGYESKLDWNKIIPDKKLSLATKGVLCWNFGQHAEMYQSALKDAGRNKLNIKSKLFEDYSEKEWDWLKNGTDEDFSGLVGYFKWLDAHRYKPHYRIHAARFRKYELCEGCFGDRLKEISLACKIQNLSLAEVCRKSVKELSGWLDAIRNTPQQRKNEQITMGVDEALDDVKARLEYLLKMGLGYLSLSRSSKTLSGGELQRISMSRCLGSALTDTLFCLDEPTSGLHARDSKNILQVMKELRDLGNTIVAVEHENTVISGADHLIEIGPNAGHHGGHVVFEGKPKASKARTENSNAKRNLAEFIEITGAKTNNLKNISVKFPTAALTTVCGVSGSGKTSLIQHTLFPAVSEILGAKVDRFSGESLPKVDKIGPLSLIKQFSEIMLVSQSPLGRSSRSNIATYLGVFDDIRKIFASTETATALKLSPGSFSFNTPGGRCETCRGLGRVVEDLSFLGEMEVICPSCEGRRFDEKVLSVLYNGKNLLEVLALTVDEARAFFYDKKKIVKAFDTIMDLGLGYMTLGQNTSSFSGGEAQRLKMVELLQTAKNSKPSILVFDEPTTGLSDSDVQNLLIQLHKLADRGHTVIVVEHHLEVIRNSDWVIEIGPEASDQGGELVYQGAPIGLKGNSYSRTAPFLFKEMLH